MHGMCRGVTPFLTFALEEGGQWVDVTFWRASEPVWTFRIREKYLASASVVQHIIQVLRQLLYPGLQQYILIMGYNWKKIILQEYLFFCLKLVAV